MAFYYRKVLGGNQRFGLCCLTYTSMPMGAFHQNGLTESLCDHVADGSCINCFPHQPEQQGGNQGIAQSQRITRYFRRKLFNGSKNGLGKFLVERTGYGRKPSGCDVRINGFAWNQECNVAGPAKRNEGPSIITISYGCRSRDDRRKTNAKG